MEKSLYEKVYTGEYKMKFEVYCDESRPDLLSSRNPQAQYMVIGSLWLKSDDRGKFKTAIHQMRDKHKVGGEFKWQKVTPSRLDFYKELMDWFFDQGEDLRFRSIVVEHEKVNLVHYHENDQELGFYKFYYQMLHHWIMDFNEYSVFCDFKSNRRRDRLHVLDRCLSYSNLSSSITNVQAIRSKESILIQLTDLLTGIVAARMNNCLNTNTAKCNLVTHLENKLSHQVKHTVRSEQKFNVFVIDLHGGW
jgi:hypothetical protein